MNYFLIILCTAIGTAIGFVAGAWVMNKFKWRSVNLLIHEMKNISHTIRKAARRAKGR
jgi:hypothetical protein